MSSSGSEQRQLGVELFNETWRLIESREDDDRLLACAYASAYHWMRAPECEAANRARSEWLLSRVHVVLGRPEPALWHAHRCLKVCEEHAIGDWDLAYAYEALARAAVLAGEPSAGAWREKARAAGDAIADPEDKEHFDEDFATL